VPHHHASRPASTFIQVLYSFRQPPNIINIITAINITTAPTNITTTTTMATFEAPTSMRRRVCSKYLAKQCTRGECYEGIHPKELDPHKEPEEPTPSSTEKSISSSCGCHRCISKIIQV
jgi:hypothetical protein